MKFYQNNDGAIIDDRPIQQIAFGKVRMNCFAHFLIAVYTSFETDSCAAYYLQESIFYSLFLWP